MPQFCAANAGPGVGKSQSRSVQTPKHGILELKKLTDQGNLHAFFSVTVIYLMSFNNFDIFLMIGIAVMATILRLYDFPMPPLILAFVLGGLMEENLRRSLLISDGSWAFLWDRPLTLCIMIVILVIVGWQIYNSFFKKKL